MRVLTLYRELERTPSYCDALRAGGAEPVIRSVDEPWTLDGCQGLLLMGGNDVDPAQYGEEPAPETEEPDATLDSAEMDALGTALERDLPILAICRGMQLLNVFHGGSLLQHLDPPERHRRREGDRSLPVHPVTVAPGSLLSSIVGESPLEVNSRHHQAVQRLGSGLAVSGVRPDDGVIEALERPDRSFVLAVQWHPEDQIHRFEAQLSLFRAFARAMTGMSVGPQKLSR